MVTDTLALIAMPESVTCHFNVALTKASLLSCVTINWANTIWANTILLKKDTNNCYISFICKI